MSRDRDLITLGSGGQTPPGTPTLADGRYGGVVQLAGTRGKIPIAQAAGDWNISHAQDWTIYVQRLPSNDNQYGTDPSQNEAKIGVSWGTGGAAMEELHSLVLGSELTLHYAAAQAPTVWIESTGAGLTGDRITVTVCPGRPVQSQLSTFLGQPYQLYTDPETGNIQAWYWIAEVPWGTTGLYVQPQWAPLIPSETVQGWLIPRAMVSPVHIWPPEDALNPIGTDDWVDIAGAINVLGDGGLNAHLLDGTRMGQRRIPISRAWCAGHKVRISCFNDLPLAQQPVLAAPTRCAIQWTVER